MKRTLLLGALIGFGVLGAAAQNPSTRIVNGAVIDKNGNPVPGAVVQATGGAETETTDSDGTYQIEIPYWLESLTVSYPGYNDKKVKIREKDYALVKLRAKRPIHWFVDAAIGGQFEMNGLDGYRRDAIFGFMGGFTYNGWGAYAKLMEFISETQYSHEYIPTFTVGCIKTFSNNKWGLFAGIGFGENMGKSEYRHYSNGYYRYDYYEHNDIQFAVDLGGLIHITRHWNIICGITYITPEYNSGNMAAYVGAGYTF